MAVVRARMETDPTIEPHTRRNGSEELHRKRHAGPALNQPSFDRKVPDRYVTMLNFEMEVANMLQTKAYYLNDEEKVPNIKNWLGPRRAGIYTTLTNAKRNI